MHWEAISTHANMAWRQLLILLSALILGFAWVLSNQEQFMAWISLGFGFAYFGNGLFLLQKWPHSQWVKLSLVILFILWLMFVFLFCKTLSPIWVAPPILMFCLSFEVGMIALSFFTLALIAATQWTQPWPMHLYGWQYVSLCLLLVLIAAHRNQWRLTLMPLLHFDVDQNLYYASYLAAYLEREIHRCEREGTGLVVVALLFISKEKQHPVQEPGGYYPELQRTLRPFDGLFTYQNGLILVLPYLTAKEALDFCQQALGELHLKASIGISRYNLDQNPTHLIEQAWLAAKTARDHHQPWSIDDDQ